MLADLHTHTTASDGTLDPVALVQQAQAAGVTLLSITDHDTVAAYRTLLPQTTQRPPHDDAEHNIKIVPGIEFSSRWRKVGIHIVGLNINPRAAVTAASVQVQMKIRLQRAEQIAERLHKFGFRGALQGALQIAGSAAPGRPHFARFLVASGQVKNEQQAYRKYLGQGKPCDIKDAWPEPETVIGWIKDAGGTAVLAHPAKYRQTNLRLEELAADFAAAGGAALEVISGQQQPALTRKLAKLAGRHGLAASCGSDFHSPDQPWAQLGSAPQLPQGVTPVWELW